MKYVALLRGINVGKSVQVPMKKLKESLELIGLTNVITYLNSGNVIFDSTLTAIDLISLIENQLENEYGQKIPTLIKSSDEIINIKNSIPEDWQNDETQQTYIAYLFSDIAKPELIDELPVNNHLQSRWLELAPKRGLLLVRDLLRAARLLPDILRIV